MSDSQLKEAVEAAVTSALEPVVERLDGQERRLRKFNSQRNIALLCAAACLIAASFSVGYAWNSRVQLRDQLDTNTLALCSSARSTALAFRSRQVTESASGERHREGTRHYLERLVGQRESLRAATGLECPSLHGFATFPYLRGKALNEIEGILFRLAPERFKPPRRHRAAESAELGQAEGPAGDDDAATAAPPSQFHDDDSDLGGGGVAAEQQPPGQGNQHHPSPHGQTGAGDHSPSGQPPAIVAEPPPQSAAGNGGDASATATVEGSQSSGGAVEGGPEGDDSTGSPAGQGLGHAVEDIGETVQGLGESVGGTLEDAGDGLNCALSTAC